MISWQDHLKTLDLSNAPVEDKLWRVQNLYPILNKNGKLIPFKLNTHQMELVKMIIRNGTIDPIVILKSRQVGITTLFVIWFLDDVVHYSGIASAIQSHKQESLDDIFKVVRLAFDEMHPAFKPIETDKTSRVNVSEIRVGALNSSIEVKLEIRSKAINRIHFSEYAFTDKKRITATEGSLAPKCFKIYESTPNGMNEFHTLYKKQKELGNAFFVAWWKHGEYEIETKELTDKTEEEKKMQTDYPEITDSKLMFRRQKLGTLFDLQFNQEYPLNDDECFLLSGSMLIDRRVLMDYRLKAEKIKPIETLREDNCVITFFDRPTMKDLDKNPKAFFMGVDPAEGIGRDYSAGVLMSIDKQYNIKQAMVVHGMLSPDEFAMKVYNLMNKYYRFDNYVPTIICERNNHGHAFLSVLNKHPDYLYPNLYVYKDRRLGFLTTRHSKKMILNDLFNAIRCKEIEIGDSKTIDELFTLTLTDAGKIEAEQGYHDDLIIANALAFHGYFYTLGIGRLNLGDEMEAVDKGF